MIACIVSTCDSPWRGRVPASISYSITPREKMSVRWSRARGAGLLRRHVGHRAHHRSGFRERRFLRPGFAFGAGPRSVSFARPKSRTSAPPRQITIALPGFISRWTMPAACAAARPFAICLA